MAISIYLKLAGSIFVMCGAAGTGSSLALQYIKRLRELEKLRQMAGFLKGQIVYANAPLPEALREVGERSEGALGKMFVSVSDQIAASPGEPFAKLWAAAVDTLGEESSLNQGDRQSLAALSKYLGYMDRDTQERSLLLYLEELDQTIGEMKAQKKETCRLYTSLGIMGGMFLVLLLC